MKYFIPLIAIIFMGFFMVFGCSTEPGQSVNAGRNRTDGRADPARSGRTRPAAVNLNCKLPAQCSGSQCCEKGDKCEDKCDDWFSGTAKKDCKKLTIDTIENIDNLLEVLKDAKEDELNDITHEQVDLLCQVLDQMDHKAWLNEIKTYSTSKAKRVLEWMISNNSATALLDTIDTDDAVEILEYLLVRGHSSQAAISPVALLGGLDKAIGDDDEKVLIFAEDANNKGFINFIHEEIIAKDICKDAVLPNCYDHTTDYDCKADQITIPIRQAACQLGVYCKVIPEEDVRKNIADIVGQSTDIEDFITNIVTTNKGINVEATDIRYYQKLEDDDAEEWTNNACHNLDFFFIDSAGLPLGLSPLTP